MASCVMGTGPDKTGLGSGGGRVSVEMQTMRRANPPIAAAQVFHPNRLGLEMAAALEMLSPTTTDEDECMPLDVATGEPDRPESVSRFSRCRSARISAAL